MKETKFGVILENACRLAGRDPSCSVIPASWTVLAEMAIGAGIRNLAAEKFPMMQRIELRRFRPDWNNAVTYQEGQEVWHKERYWRLTDANSPGEPGVADGWRLLEMNEVVPFVNWEQPWENTVIDSAGIDTTRFAYEKDPKYFPDATPLRVVRVTDLGVILETPAPKEVYCRFIPEYPVVSFSAYDNQSTYSAGDVVYLASTKDVYQLLQDEPEGAPGVDPKWQPIRIREEFAPYLTRLAACEFLTEDQGKYQTRAAADAEFERLCERYHEGIGERRMPRGRFV